MKRSGMARRVLAIALALMLALAGIAAMAKMVTCPLCGGSGGTFCSSCSGTGQTRCYSCGGAGFKMTMVMTYDPISHMMMPRQQMQSCTACGGRGSQLCTSCMGRGRKTCSRCGGSGRIDDGQPQPTTAPTQTPEPYGGVDDPRVPYETKRGTVLAGTKSNRENENVSYMFDDDIYTKYCTATTSLYVIWKAPKPIAVSGYVITTANDNSIYIGRNPKSWTLYGSNTQLGRNGGSGWEKIHEVKNDTVLQDKDYSSYIFSVDPAAPAYQYFKLEVAANGGDNCIQMSEFELKGKEGEPEQEEEEATTATVDGLNYKLDNQKKTAAFTGPSKSTVTKITVPATIKANGKTYKVTEIKASACKGLAKLKTLSIGKNVRKIGKSAFQKCAKLKNITIKTKSLTSGSVGSNAFKGIDGKVVVTCPKGKAEDYRKLLMKKGIGDKATFK